MIKFTLHSLLFVVCCLLFVDCGPSNSKQQTTPPSDTILQVPAKKGPFTIEPPDTNYTGDFLDKYDNGIVKFKGFFRFGKRHGQWMAFYENGLLWSECFYEKGAKHGLSNIYYPNGQPHYKGWYKNDLRDSVWTICDSTGKEIQHLVFKKDIEIK